jgi:farnesyl diphosphate synthase
MRKAAMPEVGVDALFESRLEGVAQEVSALLDRLLSGAAEAHAAVLPARLMDAMRHATLGGGKRIRPFLLVEVANLFAVPRERSLLAGAALECVHCYSLVHDDLPAMDDDDLRRGRPTVHKAFDEATAVLAGDALLTLAFEIMARREVHADPAIRIALVDELARAAGHAGMAGGQMLDLAAEGRFGPAAQPTGETDVLALQAMKTGALLRFACRAGAILGNAPNQTRAALDRFGRALGQAYQIADDLIDVEGDAALTGKAVGKDAAVGKATLVGVLGVAGTRARLTALIAEAQAALDPFGARADTLRATASFVAARQA